MKGTCYFLIFTFFLPIKKFTQTYTVNSK